MQWLLDKVQNSAYREFYFSSTGRELSVKLNARQHGIRLNSGQQQTVFYLDTPPHTIGKKLLINQYGMELGNIAFNMAEVNAGAIVLHGERYAFQFTQHVGKVNLTISGQMANQHLLQCNIDAASMATLSTEERCSWLAGLCWCMQVHELEPQLA